MYSNRIEKEGRQVTTVSDQELTMTPLRGKSGKAFIGQYPNGEKISDKVNACIDAKVDTFYVLNVEAEDNKDTYASSFEYLSALPSGYPYLLVITSENGIYEIAEDGIITTRQEINNKLTDIIG